MKLDIELLSPKHHSNTASPFSSQRSSLSWDSLFHLLARFSFCLWALLYQQATAYIEDRNGTYQWTEKSEGLHFYPNVALYLSSDFI